MDDSNTRYIFAHNLHLTFDGVRYYSVSVILYTIDYFFILMIYLDRYRLIKNKRITYKTVGARAIVHSNTVVARATIETWIRPTFVPINLAIYSRITVDAVTRIGTARRRKKFCSEKINKFLLNS